MDPLQRMDLRGHLNSLMVEISDGQISDGQLSYPMSYSCIHYTYCVVCLVWPGA